MMSKLMERIETEIQRKNTRYLDWSDDGPGYADEWGDAGEYADSGGATPADEPS